MHHQAHATLAVSKLLRAYLCPAKNSAMTLKPVHVLITSTYLASGASASLKRAKQKLEHSVQTA